MPELTILHGCRTIQLTRGKNTLIDEADYEAASRNNWYAYPSRRSWYAKRAKTIRSRGEGRRLGKPNRIDEQLHCAIVRAQPGNQVDHKNGDGLDNRRDNLREATQSQNQRNRRKFQGASTFKGVHRAAKSWRACIYFEGKVSHLGCFATEEEAARAYDEAAKKHFGEFARTNVDIHGPY